MKRDCALIKRNFDHMFFLLKQLFGHDQQEIVRATKTYKTKYAATAITCDNVTNYSLMTIKNSLHKHSTVILLKQTRARIYVTCLLPLSICAFS